jgi:hypothetical protein
MTPKRKELDAEEPEQSRNTRQELTQPKNRKSYQPEAPPKPTHIPPPHSTHIYPQTETNDPEIHPEEAPWLHHTDTQTAVTETNTNQQGGGTTTQPPQRKKKNKRGTKAKGRSGVNLLRGYHARTKVKKDP